MGFRVLGLAYKPLAAFSDPQTTPRGELERDLIFQGLLVLSNKLKPETRAAIEELSRADVRSVMCTGDNLLTAVCVAHDCTMVGGDVHRHTPLCCVSVYNTSSINILMF